MVYKKELSDSSSVNQKRTMEVSKEIYDMIDVGWIYVEGEWIGPSSEVVENLDPIASRISELYLKLRKTDTIMIEILESQLFKSECQYDIGDMYQQRQSWRDEIKKLKNTAG